MGTYSILDLDQIEFSALARILFLECFRVLEQADNGKTNGCGGASWALVVSPDPGDPVHILYYTTEVDPQFFIILSFCY